MHAPPAMMIPCQKRPVTHRKLTILKQLQPASSYLPTYLSPKLSASSAASQQGQVRLRGRCEVSDSQKLKADESLEGTTNGRYQ